MEPAIPIRPSETMGEVFWADDGQVMEQPTRQSRAEWVASVIENRIFGENIPAGTHLGTRADLRDALNVAPSTIGEAIKLLTDRGLVTTRTGPGGGVFVTETGLTVRLARTMMELSGGAGEVADALEVRDLLESAVIVGAAQAHPTDLEAARQRLDDLAATQTFTEFYHCNLAFHLEIARHVQNDVLRTVYIGTIELVRDRDPQLRVLPGTDPAELLRARVAAHAAVYEAVAAGDVQQARAAARAHSRQGETHAIPQSSH